MKRTVSALLALLLGGAMLATAAGCAGEKSQSGNHENLPLTDQTERTVAGIDKNNPYSWFDVHKKTLPRRDQCLEIACGMSLNAVIAKLGKPQREIGYGAFVFQFDVADGSVFSVTFTIDAASELSRYDRLTVSFSTFDTAVPDTFFPQRTALNKLYPSVGEFNETDVLQVRCEQAAIGVAPYLLKDISYTADEADIAAAYRLLSAPMYAISEEEGEQTGGGYVKYDFITADGTYSVVLGNRTVWVDEQYYRLDGDLIVPSSPDVKCHSFITYSEYETSPNYDSYEIFPYEEDGGKIGEFTGLGEFEFELCDGLPDCAPRYRLESNGLVLLILSEDRFLIEGEEGTVCRITGEKNFSDLFQG